MEERGWEREDGRGLPPSEILNKPLEQTQFSPFSPRRTQSSEKMNGNNGQVMLELSKAYLYTAFRCKVSDSDYCIPT